MLKATEPVFTSITTQLIYFAFIPTINWSEKSFQWLTSFEIHSTASIIHLPLISNYWKLPENRQIFCAIRASQSSNGKCMTGFRSISSFSLQLEQFRPIGCNFAITQLRMAVFKWQKWTNSFGSTNRHFSNKCECISSTLKCSFFCWLSEKIKGRRYGRSKKKQRTFVSKSFSHYVFIYCFRTCL